jgi:putative membrane protein
MIRAGYSALHRFSNVKSKNKFSMLAQNEVNTESDLIQRAEFNLKIKTYLLVAVGFVLAITLVGIPLLAFWFLGFGQYYSRRYYENLKCELNHRHLEFAKGVFFKIEKTIPLDNIQDLTFIENPFLKYFDLCILKIETAGQSNPQGSDMKLIGIIKPRDFKAQVLRQRELISPERKSKDLPTCTSTEQTNKILLEIRDILSELK